MSHVSEKENVQPYDLPANLQTEARAKASSKRRSTSTDSVRRRSLTLHEASLMESQGTLTGYLEQERKLTTEPQPRPAPVPVSTALPQQAPVLQNVVAPQYPWAQVPSVSRPPAAQQLPASPWHPSLSRAESPAVPAPFCPFYSPAVPEYDLPMPGPAYHGFPPQANWPSTAEPPNGCYPRPASVQREPVVSNLETKVYQLSDSVRRLWSDNKKLHDNLQNAEDEYNEMQYELNVYRQYYEQQQQQQMMPPHGMNDIFQAELARSQTRASGSPFRVRPSSPVAPVPRPSSPFAPHGAEGRPLRSALRKSTGSRSPAQSPPRCPPEVELPPHLQGYSVACRNQTVPVSVSRALDDYLQQQDFKATQSNVKHPSESVIRGQATPSSKTPLETQDAGFGVPMVGPLLDSVAPTGSCEVVAPTKMNPLTQIVDSEYIVTDDKVVLPFQQQPQVSSSELPPLPPPVAESPMAQTPVPKTPVLQARDQMIYSVAGSCAPYPQRVVAPRPIEQQRSIPPTSQPSAMNMNATKPSTDSAMWLTPAQREAIEKLKAKPVKPAAEPKPHFWGTQTTTEETKMSQCPKESPVMQLRSSPCQRETIPASAGEAERKIISELPVDSGRSSGRISAASSVGQSVGSRLSNQSNVAAATPATVPAPAAVQLRPQQQQPRSIVGQWLSNADIVSQPQPRRAPVPKQAPAPAPKPTKVKPSKGTEGADGEAKKSGSWFQKTRSVLANIKL